SIALFTFLVSAMFLSGCNRTPTVRTVVDPPRAPENVWAKFYATCRYNEDMPGADWTRIRAGLDTLSRHFSKPDVIKKIDAQMDKIRKSLESDVHLTADELAEVESPSLRTGDAHYLDECLLLRDVVKSMEIDDLPPAQRARHLFAWTMR